MSSRTLHTGCQRHVQQELGRNAEEVGRHAVATHTVLGILDRLVLQKTNKEHMSGGAKGKGRGAGTLVDIVLLRTMPRPSFCETRGAHQ